MKKIITVLLLLSSMVGYGQTLILSPSGGSGASSPLPTDASKESKQDAIALKLQTTNDSLTKANANLMAIIGKLNLINSNASANGIKIDNVSTTANTLFKSGQVIGNTAFIANAGTNLNTSTLAIESGGTLSTIAGKDFATQATLSALNTKVVTTANGIKTDGSATTQPVSVASLPLPSGSSTSDNQSTEITALNLLHSDLVAPTPSGTNVIGKTGIDQTTQGTTNFVVNNQSQIAGTTIATGNGAVSAGVQRVAIANDNSAITTSNAIPASSVDIASSAITVNTTTTSFIPISGISYSVQIPVTALSGTSPILDVSVQESRDGGTTWGTSYIFPSITTTGTYTSPTIPYNGNRIRYVQTLSGTSPSFTRSLNRVSTNTPIHLVHKNQNKDSNSTITSGGVAQVLDSADNLRLGFEFQNNSTSDMWLSFGRTAGVSVGMKVSAGAYYNSPAPKDNTSQLSIYGATTGQAFWFLKH